MKTFKTIDNRPYVATVTAEATVTDKSTGLVLAKATEAGQITFLAIGEKTDISDDRAVVVPASFNGASAGSASGGGVSEKKVIELVAEQSNAYAGNNTHTGVETFNGPVVFNATVLSSGYDVTRNALANIDTAGAASFALMIDASNGLLPPTSMSSRNSTAYVASNLKAPSSVGELARHNAGFTQDDPHTYYHYSVHYSDGVAVFFGAAGLSPQGDWQESRPYMLVCPDGYAWLLSHFCILGADYCGNDHPCMILYDAKNQDIVYAEILGKDCPFKTFALHKVRYSSGDCLVETIYSGFVPSTWMTPVSYAERTEVITYRSRKCARNSGAVVVAGTAAGYGREVNMRVYAAPMIIQDNTGLADAYAQASLASFRGASDARSFDVSGSNGEAVPETITMPAEGGSVGLTISAYASGDRRSLGRVYVQALDPWLSSDLGVNFVAENKARHITISITANDTTGERKGWVLIGQVHGPAKIVKIVQTNK